MTFWNVLKKIARLPRIPFVWLIKAYQKTLSPDHGFLKIFFRYGYCRFNPSCSEYGRQALEKYGLIRGIPLTIWRVLRCNPFSKGGDDPLK
ncbi:membrane protein insertion efficiency factor YidD [Candidatus Gracilibacteria bacterium]|nr:membrane protein insertion efficiency factor YidD [Candidatus Gracilibacteria bacterium]